MKLTQEQFIVKAKDKDTHDKYDYSKVVYQGWSKSVITCQIH